MATSGEQGTYAAQKQKNWAAPGEAGFGQAGYINQADYDAYQGSDKAPAPVGGSGDVSRPMGTPTPQTAGQALTGGATVGATPAQGSTGTAAGAFQQAMMNALAPGEVNAQNSAIQPAIQANQLAEQRGFENNRALAAEMAAANGTNNSGGMNTTMMGLAQDRAAREGQFSANAVQGLKDKQESAKMMMAQLAGGMLSGNDQLGVQKSGQEIQGALGQGDLALRGELGRGQLGLGLLGQQLQNQQFGQQLGSNNAQFSAGLNQDALMRMLGGL